MPLAEKGRTAPKGPPGTVNSWGRIRRGNALKVERRKRSQCAAPTGQATPERVQYLRDVFPDEPWVEAYENGERPDREAGITPAMIEAARCLPFGEAEAVRLSLVREFSMVRWRTWLNEKLKAWPIRGSYCAWATQKRRKEKGQRPESGASGRGVRRRRR